MNVKNKYSILIEGGDSVNRAIFCDRDGVINDNTKHVNKPEDLVIYDAAKKGLQKAYQAGYDLFVVTNQGGIELGFLKEEDLEEIHKKMREELAPYCKIKAIKYCPDFHRKTGCRKPEPGMILELAKEYQIDLSKSWMIGDMDTDIEAGIRAGCKTAKIGKENPKADINAQNLLEIVEQILRME